MRELEAAVAVLQAPQVGEPAADRRPGTPAARSASIAAAVSFESGWPPAYQRPAAVRACRRSTKRTAARGRAHAPAAARATPQIVEFTVGPIRPFGRCAARSRARSRPASAERRLGERDERDVGRAPAARSRARRGRRARRRSERPDARSPSAAHAVSSGPASRRARRSRRSAPGAPAGTRRGEASDERPRAAASGPHDLRLQASRVALEHPPQLRPGREREHEVPGRVGDVEPEPAPDSAANACQVCG